MPCRYRAIFFDLDGTLISERAGVDNARAAVASMLREAGHQVTDDEYARAAQAVIEAAIAGNGGSWPTTFSRIDAITETVSMLGISAVSTEVVALSERYKRMRLDSVERLPAAIDVLREAAAERPLGLITNGPSDEQREKLRRSELEPYFQSVTISGDLGVAKPEAAIFEHALASLAVAAEESVYIGNNFAGDIVGACEAGMDAIWMAHDRALAAPVGRQGSARPVATIRNLHELPAILGLGKR